MIFTTKNARIQNFDFLANKLIYTVATDDKKYSSFEKKFFRDKKLKSNAVGHGQSWGIYNSDEYSLGYNKYFDYWCPGAVVTDEGETILSASGSELSIRFPDGQTVFQTRNHMEVPQGLAIRNNKIYIPFTIFTEHGFEKNILRIYDIKFKLLVEYGVDRFVPKWFKFVTKDVEVEGIRFKDDKLYLGITGQMKLFKNRYLNYVKQINV